MIDWAAQSLLPDSHFLRQGEERAPHNVSLQCFHSLRAVKAFPAANAGGGGGRKSSRRRRHHRQKSQLATLNTSQAYCLCNTRLLLLFAKLPLPPTMPWELRGVGVRAKQFAVCLPCLFSNTLPNFRGEAPYKRRERYGNARTEKGTRPTGSSESLTHSSASSCLSLSLLS